MSETAVLSVLFLSVAAFCCATLSAGVSGERWPTLVSLYGFLFLTAIIVMLVLGVKVSNGTVLAVGGGTITLSAVIVHFAFRRSPKPKSKEQNSNDAQQQA